MTTTAKPKPIPNADMIRHARWCQPPPGEAEARVESFLTSREDEHGRVTSRPRTTRCLECAEQVIVG